MKRLLALLMVGLMLGATSCTESFKEGFNDAVGHIQEEVNKEVTRGTISGDTYYSDFTGVTFTKPESWRFCTDEELAELINIGEEQIDANAFAKTLAEVSSVYDMMAIDEQTSSNIIVCYENTKVSAGTSLSEEEYLKALEEQLKGQMDCTLIETTAVTLCGEEYLRAVFDTEAYGRKMKTAYYSRCVGDYMVCYIASLVGGVEVEDLEAMFN